jgi:hypothetical protein
MSVPRPLKKTFAIVSFEHGISCIHVSDSLGQIVFTTRTYDFPASLYTIKRPPAGHDKPLVTSLVLANSHLN